MRDRLAIRHSGIMKTLGLAALFAALMGSPAMAAGGAVPTLVQDMGAALLFAGGIAVIFARLKIPSIAAFILAGVFLGPQGFHMITDPANVDTIAQIGFVLLLFVIGLEINLRSLFSGGKLILLVGLAQYPITLLFGMLFAKLVIYMGLGGVLDDTPLGPLYLGIAIAGSSSLLVVKLFQEHFQLDTQPGRISLTILIFQDIWAIVVTLIQPAFDNPDIKAIGFSFLGIAILVVVAIALSRTIADRAFSWIAKMPELILLGAMSWCFAMVAIGTNIDHMTEMLGFNWHMAVSSGMAALIAGATIASSPYSTEIVTKVGLVKDFFITLFFVGLGIALPAINGWSGPLTALGVAFLAVLARQLVFFPLLYLAGVDQRNAQVSSIRLSQISEFGLVISYLGLSFGHIGHDLSSAIILAFVFTAIMTTPLFEGAYRIHEIMQGFLNRIGFKEPEETIEEESDEVELAILGIHRDASSFITELAKTHPHLIAKTTVVDFNVAIHDRIRGMGVKVKYGDISNEESLIHAGVNRAKIIVCTISDDLLRGINNRDLVRLLRHMNPEATIISNAIQMQGWRDLKAAGADIVYMSRLEVAKSLVRAVVLADQDRAEEFVDEQYATVSDARLRREIMD